MPVLVKKLTYEFWPERFKGVKQYAPKPGNSVQVLSLFRDSDKEKKLFQVPTGWWQREQKADVKKISSLTNTQ